MVLGYIATQESVEVNKTEFINNYIASKNLKLKSLIKDDVNRLTAWQDRSLKDVINEASSLGVDVVVYEGADLSKSMAQVIEVLGYALSNNVNIHFAKYDLIYEAKRVVSIRNLINIVDKIEHDFVSRRTTNALAKRRAAGLPLGRPKGKFNKSLKLDKHRKAIKRYLDLNVSKASIAKLIDCNAQTLYNYIDKRNLEKIDS